MKPAYVLFLSVLLFFLPTGYSQEKYPTAKPTGKPGVVASPYGKNRFLDVENLEPGSLAKDPVAGKVFRIPFPELSKSPVPVERGTPQIANPVPSSQLDPGIQFGNGLPPGNQKPPQIGFAKLPRDLVEFIHAFNEASSVNDAGALSPFYAERVDSYFGDRNVSRRSIYNDRVAYINRFPERNYTLLEEPALISTDGTHYEVTTRVGYSTRGRVGERNGSVTGYFKIRRTSRGYEITSMNEAKIKSVPIGQPQEFNMAPVGGNTQFEQIERFIEAYVASGDSNDPAANVNFMHSRVESYYGTRNPSRSALLRDRSHYINRWPQRSYWLTEKPQINPLRDGTFEVVSRIGYDVRNGAKNSRGETTSIARVANTSSGLRIVSVRER